MKLISNIINCFGSGLNIIGISIKDKSKILLFFTFGNLLVAIALGLLGAYVGMIVQLTFTVESCINYFWEKKHDKYPIWLIILYIALPCALSFITFSSWWDMLPIIASVLFPLALLSKGFKIRLLNLFSVISWIPYNFHFGQYVGGVSCIIFTIMNILAIIRIDFLKQEKKEDVKIDN